MLPVATFLLRSDAAPASSEIAACLQVRLPRLLRLAQFPFFKDHRIKLTEEDGTHRTLTQAAATGNHYGAVVEGVVRLGEALIRARRSRVELGRTFHFERFVRPFVVELLYEIVKFGLLLK